MSFEAPCNITVAKNTLKGGLWEMFWGEGQWVCPLMAVKENGLKECRGRCNALLEVGEGWGGHRGVAGPAWEEHSRGREGCRGTRRREKCRSYVAEEWGEEERKWGQMMSEDQRSSVSGMEAVSERRARTRSMALFSARRHSFILRKVWTWAIAGKACTEEERDTERGRQRKHAGKQAVCREKDSYRHYIHIRIYGHAPTHLLRQGKRKDPRDLWAKLI